MRQRIVLPVADVLEATLEDLEVPGLDAIRHALREPRVFDNTTRRLLSWLRDRDRIARDEVTKSGVDVSRQCSSAYDMVLLMCMATDSSAADDKVIPMQAQLAPLVERGLSEGWFPQPTVFLVVLAAGSAIESALEAEEFVDGR